MSSTYIPFDQKRKGDLMLAALDAFVEKVVKEFFPKENIDRGRLAEIDTDQVVGSEAMGHETLYEGQIISIISEGPEHSHDFDIALIRVKDPEDGNLKRPIADYPSHILFSFNSESFCLERQNSRNVCREVDYMIQRPS